MAPESNNNNYNKGEEQQQHPSTEHTAPSVMMGDAESDLKDQDLDDEIIMDHKAPLCTKTRMRIVTWGSLAVALICLIIVIPAVVVNSNKSASSPANTSLGNTWTPLGDSLVDDIGADNDFGESVALSGNGLRVAIGANAADSATGRVIVKKFEGSFWKPMGKDGAIQGPSAGSNFGHVVQLSENGNIVVASGFGNNVTRGIVQSYKYQDNEWKQFGGDVRTPSNQPGDRFGVSLSLSAAGDAFIVGADGDDNDDPRNGAAYVYALQNDEWKQKGQVFVGSNDSRMGYAVAMSGDGNTICIGERDYKLDVSGNRRGQVYCHYWQEDQNAWLVKGDRMRGTYNGGNFGYSMSLNHRGNRVAVGNRQAGAKEEGSVTVFQIHKGKWDMMGNEMVSGTGKDQGGFQVALNREGDGMYNYMAMINDNQFFYSLIHKLLLPPSFRYSLMLDGSWIRWRTKECWYCPCRPMDLRLLGRIGRRNIGSARV